MTQICYASALREETARRNFFANALALTRATRGKGIVVSSSARSAFELRGPYDVINMATLFGLSEQDAKVSVLPLLASRCFDPDLDFSVVTVCFCNAHSI